MAERLKAADCKSAGPRPTEVRILLSPPLAVGCWLSGDPESLEPRAKSGSNSVGRVTAFQAVGRGFESRLPLGTTLA